MRSDSKRGTRRHSFGWPIRHPSPSMVVAIIALAFAMVGTATATNVLIGNGGNGAQVSAKKKAKPGPPGPPGQTGAQGPAGAAGTAGTNGTNGTPGTNGTNGTNGSSAASILTGRTLAALPGAAGVLYLEPSGSSTPSASPTFQAHISPIDMTVSNLRAEIDADPGAGNSRIFELLVNGAPAGPFCYIDQGFTGCHASGGGGSAMEQDDLMIRVTTVGTPPATEAEFGWRGTTP